MNKRSDAWDLKWLFYFIKFLFIMVYLFNCINDAEIEMKISPEEHYLIISIDDKETSQQIVLSKKDVYELTGILHYIQKNIQK
jgi:hypothetical protein